MTASRRRHRWQIAGAAVGVVVLVIAAGEISGWPFLRGPLQSALTSAAKVPVKLDGDFHVRFLWRPTLQVGHLEVAPASGVKGPPVAHLLDATAVDLRWSWLDLWRWRRGAPLRLTRLHAGTLDSQLVRDAEGHATWQVGGDPAVHKADDAQRSALDSLPRIGSLQIGDGLVVLKDAITDTDLQVEIKGGEGSKVSNGGYMATAKGRYQKLPLDLKVSSGAVLPLLSDADGSDAGDAQAGIDFSLEGTAGAAQIEFKGKAAAVFGARQLDGSLTFSGPSLAQVGEPLGITLPRTPAFALQGRLAHNDGVWKLKADKATIGSSALDGDFSYDTRTRPGRLTGRLGGKRLALADLGPAIGGPTSDTEKPVTAAADRVLPDRRFDLPSLRGMTADVRIDIGELDLGSDFIGPLNQLKTQLTLDDAVLRLQHLSATVAGGDFAGSSSLDARKELAKWILKLRFSAVDVSQWVQGLKTGAKPGSGKPQAYVTGKLQGDLDVAGAGNSTAQIIGNLNGKAMLRIDDGSISHLLTEAAGLDLAQALGMLIKGDQSLPMRCARAQMEVTNGTVKIDRMVIDNADSTIRAAGRINLQQESLALMAASRPKDFSPLSLNSTVFITGKIKSPSVSIDAGKLAAKAAGAAVLGAVAGPLAAVLPFLEFGDSNDKADVCAAIAGAAAPSKSASAPGR